MKIMQSVCIYHIYYLHCNRFQYNLFVYGSIHGDDGFHDTYTMCRILQFVFVCAALINNNNAKSPQCPRSMSFAQHLIMLLEHTVVFVRGKKYLCNRYCPGVDRKKKMVNLSMHDNQHIFKRNTQISDTSRIRSNESNVRMRATKINRIAFVFYFQKKKKKNKFEMNSMVNSILY